MRDKQVETGEREETKENIKEEWRKRGETMET